LWTGPKITFAKTDYADWTQEANQDWITNNVWITRKDSESIYNITTENGFQRNISPEDTEWAFGKIDDGVSNLTFKPFSVLLTDGIGDWILSHPNYVLHLITDDIYIDVSFISWTNGGNGGGFSYERSTPAPLGIDKINLKHMTIFPNPVRDMINIKELKTNEPYKIISL